MKEGIIALLIFIFFMWAFVNALLSEDELSQHLSKMKGTIINMNGGDFAVLGFFAYMLFMVVFFDKKKIGFREAMIVFVIIMILATLFPNAIFK
jgi:hypothetical protein